MDGFDEADCESYLGMFKINAFGKYGEQSNINETLFKHC